MTISSLLISNKKLISCSCLATNNNFLCRQELKILGALPEQKRFSFDNLACAVFLTKVKFFIRIRYEVMPQITISQSTKSGRETLIFSPFTQKKVEIHDGTTEEKTD